MPGTHVHTTVQKFIVVVIPATYVPTTVQKFIVVVIPDTNVHTTVQIFIVREGGKGKMVLEISLKLGMCKLRVYIYLSRVP